MTIQHLAIKSIGRIQIVPVGSIIFIKGANNYLEVHTDKGIFLHREALQALCEKLDQSKFVRVHRSALININHLKEINSELGRYSVAQLTNGEELKIGSAYKDELFTRLGIQ
ncbi:LytR/AlgR family response regulator transcription factor [Arsukibacterium indicum]|uniref:LytTR family transcriptional regulator n=1 Tax=Arsukibacterium indicum TaxID=2848612 RepID=A0ABS6MNU1_9GAMM|nr:LytTR family DNA-binding domain-containing protein [Arsukibacterium indicum]MBV2130479.1 LytTR family transcriptional regulator [Arsukibacterium indicum]